MNFRQLIVKQFLFPVMNLKNRFSNILVGLEKSQWFTYREIQKIQLERLKKLLHYAYHNVPYYKELFTGEKINFSEIDSLGDLKKIPTLSKKIINENFNKMFGLKTDMKALMPQTTSGSTGQPVTIYWDKTLDRIHNAVGWRFRRWAGHDFGVEYAKIWGQKPEKMDCSSFKTKIKQRIKDFVEPVEILNAFDELSAEEMDKLFQKIKNKNIKFLLGYASSVYLFAQFVNENHNGEITLHSVRTISEMLYSHQRTFIEKVFKSEVFDVYGNRENGLIASECDRHEGYHINAENLFVEILDSKGNPLPDGKTGEIAITDLNNYVMPLIRYLTGDHGSISAKLCPCGRGLPLIEKINGRAIDMLLLSDGNYIDGSFIIDDFPLNLIEMIERFSIVQNAKGKADFFIKLLKPLSKDEEKLIKKTFNEKLHNRLLINYHFVDELPFRKSGKHKYIISNIKK